ncbi:MAG: PilZ domain-containing protein [Deltaproteobacteria bacterium]|nr:MAG: PilZ domain-containing protein [Deltaproteobacteria bacterium]
MTAKEKRKFIRIDSLNLSYVLVDGNDDEEKQTMGRTLNVSEAGIRLETAVPVELNSNLTLTIGLEEDLVDIKGTVVHSSKGEGDRYQLGVKFLGKDEKASKILKKFIKAFQKQRRKTE